MTPGETLIMVVLTIGFPILLYNFLTEIGKAGEFAGETIMKNRYGIQSKKKRKKNKKKEEDIRHEHKSDKKWKN